MPKISVSMPSELLDYLDHHGPNRSQVIVTILNEHRSRERQAELERAYREYERLSEEEDGDWWPAWEAAAARDVDA